MHADVASISRRLFLDRVVKDVERPTLSSASHARHGCCGVYAPCIHKERRMNTEKPSPLAKSAIHTMAEIKAVTEAFDRGETNVFDALDAVMLAIAAYRAAEQRRRKAA